ncbi:hypothetical protein D1AOALGA4SA_12933 [Olavius algarvensis Delta 1 endosymbiont]|nr:hypothetical protein D1AOALGA4SA_12933 [Olavius algarvensis Delta 1 endosymbiont]
MEYTLLKAHEGCLSMEYTLLKAHEEPGVPVEHKTGTLFSLQNIDIKSND